MYTFRYALVSVLLLFFGLSKVESQITDVDFLIQYNPETCLYEACIVIVGGSATSYPHRIQFNSQYSIVVPAGTNLTIDTVFWPKENNATYTGTLPCKWEFGPEELAPPIQPQHDFHTVIPNISPPSAFNNLMTGDTVRLFGLSTNAPLTCETDIRPFIIGSDPNSGQMPGGGDFSCGYTIGSGNQLYRDNLETIHPPLPEIEWDIDCSGDITVNVTPLDSFVCQHPYGILWTGPPGSGFSSSDISPTIPSPAMPGIYEAFITDAYGCDTTIYIQVDGPPMVTNSQVICGAGDVTLENFSGAGTGTWTLVPPNTTGAVIGATFSGTATATFDVNASGLYTFVYTGDGCDAVTEITVAPSTSVPTVNNNGPLCVGETLMLTTDYVDGATYFWENTTSGYTSTDEDPIINNVTINDAGDYTLVVTAGGCPSSPATTTVVINDIPATPTPSSNTPLCEGETINLTTDFVAGGTYLWSGPGSFSSTDREPTIPNAVQANSGQYCVIVTVNDCPSLEGCTDVVVNPKPNEPTASSNEPICEGDDLNLTTDFVAGATYLWSGPGSFSSTDREPTISGATPADNGNYCVVLTIDNCDSDPGCVDVTITPTPPPPTANNNGPLCEEETLNLTTDFVAGATYAWSGPGSFTSSMQNPTITGVTLADEGTYCVTVTVNNCPSIPDCTDVDIKEKPALPIADNNGPLCTDDDLQLTTDAVTNGSYAWTGPDGFVSTQQNPTILNVTTANAGTYCVIVTVDGCPSDQGCTNVVISETPITPTASSNSEICEGEDLNLTTDFVAGATYAWTGPDGYMSSVQNPTITNASPSDDGQYCVVVTVGLCSSGSDCTDVVVNPTPETPTVSSNSPICSGDTIFLYTDEVLGASYLWEGPTGIFFPEQNPVITGSAAIAGTYCLIVTLDGCDSEEACTDIVITPTPPSPTVSTVPPLCEGQDLQLTASLVPGATYVWSGPNGFNSNEQSPIRTNITLADQGTYTLLVVVDGCESSSISTNVTIYPTPDEPMPTSNSPLCEGDDLELSVTTVTNATYRWSGPNGFISFQQDPTITGVTVADAGTYCVVISLNGCDSEPGCIDVIINPIPPTPVANNNGPLCQDQDLELTTDAVTDAMYAWTGPDGFTSTEQNPIITGATTAASGSYCVIVTVNGCSSLEGCTDVTVNETPATPIANNNGPICENEDLELTTDAVTDAMYAWTGPDGFTSTEQNPIITGATTAASGSYCVTVTVNNCPSLEGCTDVTVNLTPATPVANNNGPLCQDQDLELTTDAVTDATYAWTGPDGFTSTEQNPIITGATTAASGSYCVVVTVNDCPSLEGCTDVVINATPATPIANNNGPLCDGGDLELTTDAVTDATYAWTGPDGFTSTEQNPIITGATTAASGSYCVVVTVNDCPSLEGCTDVVVNATPATPVANNNGPLCQDSDLELTTDAVTDATYAWTGPDGFTSTEQNPIITGATPAASGSYCVVVTVNDCPSLVGCTDVVINATPATPVANNNGPLCDGEDLELTTDAVTDATYAWTGPDGFTSTEQNPIITGATTAASGSYCVVVTVNNCPSLEGCTDVTVNLTPATPVANNNGPLCQDADLELTTDAVTDATYAWTGPEGFTSTEQNPIITGATPAASGSYCVVVTVNDCPSLEGCTDVVINATPVTPVANNNGPLCQDSDLELTTDAVTDATYAWTGPDGFTSTEQSPIITGATPAASGSYCVVVTVNDCPSLEGCTDVVVNATPATPVANNNGPLCQDSDLELTTDAVTDATYAWTGPDGFTSTEQNPIITGATPAASGSYCVVVTVNDCPSLEGCTDVVVNATPATPVANNNGPLCQDSDLELTTGAVTGATYAWTGPDGFTSTEQNPIITGATPAASGSYCVVVTVNDCPSLEGCTDVTVNATPATPIVNNNGPICEGEDLELTTDAVTGATYAWTGPDGFTSTEQNPIITDAMPSASGSYCLIMTVNDCPSLEACTDVIVKPTPDTPTANSNGPVCEGGDLMLSTDLVANATYEWTGPIGFTSTEQNPTLSGVTILHNGNFCVVVTVDGCVSEEDCVYVEVKPTPAAPIVDNNGPICEGTDLNLTSNVISAATYVWTGPNGFMSSVQNPVIANASPSDNGQYCLYVIVNDCPSEVSCTDVIVKPTPDTPIASYNDPICEDETLELYATLVSGGSYTWTGPNGYSSSLQNPIISGATPQDNGTYCVFVTIDGCDSETSCIDVFISPTPPTPIVSNNSPICEDGDIELYADNIAGASYFWSGPNGFTSNQQSPIISNADPSASGNYCLYVTVNGCDSEYACTNVIVNPTPNTPIASSNQPLCENDNLELSATFIAGATYTWTGPNGFTSNQQNPNIVGATPANNGLYCVFVTVDGCDSESNCIDITITPTPNTPIVSDNGPICEQDNIELSASFISGAIYSWSGPNGFTSNEQNPSISGATPTNNGTYCVFVTVDGCDSESACTEVVVTPTPPTPTVSNNGPICEDGTIELSAGFIANATYQWSGPNGFTSTQQNPSITNADPNNDSGQYCVVVTVDNCVSEAGCTDVIVNATPATPTASNNGPICEDENLELSTNFVPGGSYAWSGPNGFTSTQQNPSISGATPSNAGQYCVIVTVNNCVSEAGCTDVIVTPTPSTPIANNNGPICEGENLELTTDAVVNGSYVWTGPDGFTSTEQNPIILGATPTDAGTYCVVVTVDNCISEAGCTNVIINPTPDTPTASNNGPICEGQDIELATSEVTGATYSWTGPNGFTSNLQNPTITGANPNQNGSYCIEVTVNGCLSASSCTNVIVNPTPDTPVVANNGAICEGETLELTTDAVAGATYSWTGPNSFSSNEQNPTINNASPSDGGSYCLTIIIEGCVSEAGCTDVIVNPTPTTPVVSENGPICEGENLELYTATVVGASYSWSGPDGFTSTAQNPIIIAATPADNGNYCVVVTVDDCESAAGCIDIIIKPTPADPNPSNNGPVCEGENIELTTSAVAGASYSWSGPDGFTSTQQDPSIPNASASNSGSYCVVITIDDCESASVCTEVIVKPTPDTPIANNNGPICEGGDLELTTTTVTNGSYLWTGPNGYSSTEQNPTITGATPSDNGSYCVVVTVDGCESEPGCTEVIISPEISAGPDQSILCAVLEDIVVTMDATATSDGSWSTGTNPGSVSIGTLDSETTTITNFTVVGTYTFIWSNGVCTDEVEITITAQPNAGEDQSVKCNVIGSAIMAAEGSGTWTLGSVAGTVTFDANDPNTIVTDFENPGTYELIWTIGDCSDTVIMDVDDDCECPIGENIIDGNPEDYCGLSEERLIVGQDATPPGGTYQWQYDDGILGFVDLVGTNSKDYTTDALGIGTHTFRRIYSIASPDCADTSNYVIMNVMQQPTAGSDQELLCQDLATLQVIMDGTGTGNWNQVSGPGGATIVTNNDPASPVTVTESGTYVFSFGDALCFDEVSITITEAADAGPDQSVDCFATGSAIMAAVADPNGSWSWGTAPDQPAFNMTDANAAISGFGESGSYELIWTVGDCSDSVIITVGDDCDCPIANNNLDQPNPSQYCGEISMIDLTGSAATPDGEYTWEYSTDGTNFASASGDIDLQNYTTGTLSVGTHYFRRVYTTTSAPICTDFSNVIEITVLDQPNAGADQTLECIDLPGGSVIMDGSSVGTWSKLTTNFGDATIVSSGLSNTEINGFTDPGTYGFVYSNDICTDTVFVLVTESVDAGPDQNVECYVTGSATMAAVSASGGTWSVGVIPATASEPSIISLGSSNTLVENFDVPGTYELIWTVGDCSDIVQIVVGDDCDCPIAGNNIIQPVPSEYCDTSPMILIVGGDATPIDGTYNWEYSTDGINFNTASGTFDERDYTTTALGLGVHTFRRNYIIETPDCELISNEVTITVLETPDAGIDQTLACIDLPGSTTMSASGTGVWTANTGNPSEVTIGDGMSPTTPITGFAAVGDYFFTYSNGTCTDEVMVTVSAAADAGADQSVTCFLTGTASLSATGTGVWSYGTTPGGDQPTFNMSNANTTISGFASAGTYIIIWTSNGCEDTMEITVGEECSCPIANNVITQPSPEEFCDMSDDITIIGLDVSPSGGEYTWEYSTDGTNFSTASGTFNQRDYNTGALGIGDHTFRRIYDLTSPVCSDTSNIVTITVLAQPDAGIDQVLSCVELPATVTMAGTGPGIWTANGGNPSSVNILMPSSPTTEISGLISGDYIFTFSNGICTDEVMVTVTEIANAGADQSFDCYETATAVMSASGNGTWSWGTTPSGDQPTLDPMNPNTSITGFAFDGDYNLIWTNEDGCTDTVVITVGAICDCPIADNIIVAPNPNNFCGGSMALSITGLDATPAGGTYFWEYSLDGGLWNPAPGVNNLKDYTTDLLSVGEHRYRRTYTITSPIGCENISNIVTVNVAENANAGPDQDVECYEDGIATMAAIGTGMWSWGTTPSGDQPVFNMSDPNATITGFGFAGTYELIWTTADDCTDTAIITVGNDCLCPIVDNTITAPDPNEFCGDSEIITILGSDAMPSGGTYTWEYSFNNGAFGPTNNADDQKDYTTIALGVGEHRFRRVYDIDTPIDCEDVSNVVLIVVYEDADAGPNQTVDCYENGIATMGASGTGTWTWGSTPGDFPALDDMNPNAVISGFGSAGVYELIWTTDGICTDIAIITVGNNCDCPINNNTITQPDPNEFCGESEILTIVGSAAQPAGGTYTWEYSFNNGAYGTTNNADDQKDYTTINLGVGEHRFRRVYDIDTPIDCEDVSNVVLIVVYEDANAGLDQTIDCYEDGIATMAASGTGTWSWGSTPGDFPALDDTNPNAVISGFGSAGVYELIWTTDGICTDIAIITVGANCDCPILDNEIIQPSEYEFCNASQTFAIVGLDATPAGGTYTWEYSFNNGAFVAANGIIDEKDYITQNLGPGEHRFRRVYDIDTPFDCEETSNVVLIIVYGGDAGLDQTVDCFEDGMATMAASGTGVWSWGSTPGDFPALDDTNPNAVITGFGSAGVYELIWTIGGGVCTDIATITVDANCDCPIENNTITQPDPNEFCGESEVLTIIGSDATPSGGTYTWEYSFNNGAYGSTNNADDQRDYTTIALGVGEHRFRRVYDVDTPIDCEDVSNVVLIVVYEDANAGLDQTVDCYEDGMATMAASGTGTWSWGSTPGDFPTLDDTNPNAVITGFGSAGVYELIWTTDGICTDIAIITVGNNCNCPIDNNTITQPDPNEFCGESELLTIIGSDATPSGGTYTWEYSFNNGAYGSTNNADDQRDYNTIALGVGEHRFRRVYDIDTPFDCEEVSNVVLIVVYEDANAGLDQTVDCYEDGMATMAASGTGTWSWGSTPGDFPALDDTNPSAVITGFGSAGVYELIWTTDGICTDIAIITVGANCNCPIDNNSITQPDPNEFCGESVILTIIGSDAQPTGGTYTWEYSFNNGAYGSTGNADDQRDYTTDALGVGEHRFRRNYTISSPMDCAEVSNEVLIIVYEDANAGVDQTVDCYEDGMATMAASGTGTWSWGSTPGDFPALDDTNPSAVITGFGSAGVYELIWTTDGICTDVAIITVGANCDCPIENNTITQPDPNEFCGESIAVTILGSDALPSGGTYRWEYSFNSGGFAPASGAFDQRDYTTGILGVGEHVFRRVYAITSPMDCADVSNEVSIIVYQDANAGADQMVDCFEDGVATMSAVGEGEWSWSSTLEASIDDLESATAIVSNFPQAGTYELTWTTDDGCTDIVEIEVGDDCFECEIMENDISQPIPSDYCNESPGMTIVGGNALPSNGTYTWEYSFNGSPFSPAIGSIDQPSYNTADLGPGEHRFRRRYLIQTNPICEDVSDIVEINVLGPLEAGDSQDLGCTILEDATVNMTAIGVGTWIIPNTNPSLVTISDMDDSSAIITDFQATGVYTFIWSNGMCNDEMTVNIEETKSAGEDQLVECYIDGTATLNAEGNGTWSIGSNNPGIVLFSSMTDPKAVLTNFSINGTYEFIWTVDGCEDSVIVEVGDACPCLIESNSVIDNVSPAYCETTGELLITGNEALPVGGTYLWQISIKGSPFSDAPGVNNTKDYMASNFTEGNYILRRQYNLIIDGIECSDVSDEIAFFVFDDKQSPGEITFTPNPVCLGDSLILEVEFNPLLTYNWQIMSGGGRVLYSLDSMSMIVVESPGTITVSVTQTLPGCNDNVLSTASNIEITVLDAPKPYLGQDTTFCELEETFTIYPGDFVEYEWHNGSTDPEFEVEGEGIYTVSVVDSMGCVGTNMVNIKSFCCEFAYPNIFKADSKGGNDFFKVTDMYDCVIEAELYIYDRWGNQVYIGDGLETWDGTFKGKFVEQGVYVFIYKYRAMDADREEFEDEVSGDVTVIR